MRSLHDKLALKFTYRSQGTAIYCKSFIPHNSYSLKWALDDGCWSAFHKCYMALNITIFNNSFSAERDYECQVLLCRILLLLNTEITY